MPLSSTNPPISTKPWTGVLFSAFGYQGQKCSACSRAYVHAAVYERFRTRLVEKTRALRVGPVRDPQNFMGPVISRSAMKSILQYIQLGKREGRLLTGGTASKPEEGYFIQPTIFERIKPTSRLIQEEIFGPVLVLSSMASFDDGIKQANATAYGLTGSVYSQDEAHLTAARQQFFCGNLYLNRKSTGAWVGGHPFGGFNLSGTDSKAGGPDYLLLFRQAQAISRKR
jgi:1-pyrroline-5-carboxylate dehydrogenase